LARDLHEAIKSWEAQPAPQTKVVGAQAVMRVGEHVPSDLRDRIKELVRVKREDYKQLIERCKGYDDGKSLLVEARRIVDSRDAYWPGAELAKAFDDAIQNWQPPAANAGHEPMKRLTQAEGDRPFEINPFRVTFAFLVATPSDYQRYGTKLGDSILELLKFCQPAVWQVISAADVTIDPVLKTLKNCTLMSEANDAGFPHPNPDGFHKELQKLGLSSSDSLVINPAVNSYDGGKTKTKLLVGFAFRDKEQCCYYPLRNGCAVPGVTILESEPGHVTVIGDVLGLYRSR